MQTIDFSELYTTVSGASAFRHLRLALPLGTSQTRLSHLATAGSCQFRFSPVGYASGFHYTENPQWLFVLAGKMVIGLHDGSDRVFGPGECFYSNDTPVADVEFDPKRHGHCSRQHGPDPLVTAFVRCSPLALTQLLA